MSYKVCDREWGTEWDEESRYLAYPEVCHCVYQPLFRRHILCSDHGKQLLPISVSISNQTMLHSNCGNVIDLAQAKRDSKTLYIKKITSVGRGVLAPSGPLSGRRLSPLL